MRVNCKSLRLRFHGLKDFNLPKLKFSGKTQLEVMSLCDRMNILRRMNKTPKFATFQPINEVFKSGKYLRSQVIKWVNQGVQFSSMRDAGLN